MEIFDSLTLKAKGLLSSFAARPLPFPVSWPIPSCDPMLFKSDTAFELGCDRHSGISSLFVTSTEGLIPNDSLLLVGDPIQSLHQNGSYAKMVFVEVDESNEKIGYKIRQARQLDRAPYMLILGAKEAEAGNISVRNRAGDTVEMSVEEFKNKVLNEIATRAHD